MTTATVWTENGIKELLEKSQLAVERAIVAIYNRQTSDEKASEATKYHNSVGFNAFDAEFGTSLAERILDGRRLTEGQLTPARKVAIKYRKQLARIANGEV